MEDLSKKIIKEKQPFERLEMKKADLLKMFEYNEFKHRILNEKVTTETTTVYRCGSLIDLCRGPHVRNTGKIKAMKITKNSSTYWEGKADAESLQRVYGISFPDPKQMKEWDMTRTNFVRCQSSAASKDMVLVEVNDKTGVATVTLNRPPVNSLNLDLLQAFSKTLDDLQNNRSKGMILTSVSASFFSSWR